ncbi:hypothetical protein ACOMHN_030432 [Nucella lapillus]
MAELKQHMEEGNEKLLNKLMYFSAPIPGTKQHLRYKADKAVSFVKFVNVTSDDSDMFTLFQTFSAADLHWDDFHRTLPESEKYLGKRLVSQSDFHDLSESDKARAITKQEDYRLRVKALNDNPDKVDSYFSERLQVLLKHVIPILGALYWIIRFEVQARGTIHAHLLIGVKGGPSKHDLEKARTKNDAYLKCTDDEKREIDECRDNVLTCSCANLGISTMHPRPDPANWPGPYGQDVHTPAVNILRQRFLDVSHNPDELQEIYEKLVNRVMLHHCRDGYCLEKNSNDSDEDTEKHDLSKQECARILNVRPFVQSSKEYVNVNVMGTRKVTIPTGTEAVHANMLQDNVASVYWNRDTDSNYQVAVESFREGQASEDPATVSLFKFASKYTTRWKLRGKERVPHVTPNFRQIPNKHVSKMHDRYVLYLKTRLLVYKAGTKLSDYTKLGKDDLELEVKAFVQTSECPRLILEELQESQIFQESEKVLEREIDSDVCDDDLHIEPIIPKKLTHRNPGWTCFVLFTLRMTLPFSTSKTLNMISVMCIFSSKLRM